MLARPSSLRPLLIEEGRLRISSPGARIHGSFDQDGALLSAGGSAVRLRFTSWALDSRWTKVERTRPWAGACLAPPDTRRARPCARALSFSHPGVEEWWLGHAQGLEQGWTVREPAEPARTLELRASTQGTMLRLDENGTSILMIPDHGAHPIRYGDARAWDADGDPLPTSLSVVETEILLRVEVEGAHWPVHVDPVASSADTILTGSYDSANFGFVVAGVGDLDNDSHDDIAVIGRIDTSTEPSLEWYRGSATGLSSTRWRVHSMDSAIELEEVVLGPAGDFNSDGFADTLAGSASGQIAYFHSDPDHLHPILEDSGYVTVYTGDLASPVATERTWPADRETEPDSSVYDEPLPDFSNRSRGAGDVDGDGNDDIVVTEPGFFRVFHGAPGDDPLVLPPQVSSPWVAEDYGVSLGAGGDLNGDGLGDFAIGDPGYRDGTIDVRFGAYDDDFRTAIINAPAGADQFGTSVAIAGDVNGDGRHDLIAGSNSSGRGGAWVFHGSGSIHTSYDTSLSDDEYGSGFGNVVSRAGDINGDGFDDVMVAALDSEVVYLYRGSSSGIETEPETTLASPCSGCGYGTSIDSAGDVDDDGYDDVIISAPYYDVSGSSSRNQGRVWVHLGYQDHDGDGYGLGSAVLGPDCDDDNASIHPGATEIAGDEVDQNCDGVELCMVDEDDDGYLLDSPATTSSADTDCDDPGEGLSTDPRTDCDDENASRTPGAEEIIGDEVDNDCDDEEICFLDDDNDGYRTLTGDTRSSRDDDCQDSNEAPASAPATDCDDGRSDVYPGASEIIGNSTDDDCDGQELCYQNNDRDGYRTTLTVASTDLDCSDPGEASPSVPTLDCDDNNASIHPSASEVVGDGVDSNCDTREYCYQDSDNDGYRTSLNLYSADWDCDDSGEALAIEPSDDCNDSSASIHPYAAELVGDGVDQDCSGSDDCYVDFDRDGYGTSSTMPATTTGCTAFGEARFTGDCDDRTAAVHPTATEIAADGIDQDCDGEELCYVDADNDGHRLSSTVVSSDGDCEDSGEALSTEPADDCDDTNGAIYPGATEGVGDGINQDCSLGDLCFIDADDDGYRGIVATTITSADDDCDDAGEAWASAPATDCDDTTAAVYPGAAELTGDNVDGNCDNQEYCYVDIDEDGYRPNDTTIILSLNSNCDDPGEALAAEPDGDCDDGNPARSPAAPERCDTAYDDDCDGLINESDSYDTITWYRDADGDDFGKSSPTTTACTRPAGYAPVSGDCRDSDAEIYPGATELPGDEVDQDCDERELCYLDFDLDGFRTDETLPSSDEDCDDTQEALAVEGELLDCDDTNADVHPSAEELCDDKIDNDCDTEIDEDSAADAPSWYRDADVDGYGDPSEQLVQCTQPPGYVLDSADCDDAWEEHHPGAPEYCDGFDDDCDGEIDENSALGASTWYRDGDEDTFGNPLIHEIACEAPEGFVSDNTDCDDFDASVYPGQVEITSDGVDQDCDGFDVEAEDTGDEKPERDCGCSAATPWPGGPALLALMALLISARRARPSKTR